MKIVILSIILSFCNILAYARIDTLEIQKIIQGKEASVGVAILYGDHAYTLSNEDSYPLMSVFKLHIAVTALNKMENENIALDDITCIEPEQMRADTYSPLRNIYQGQRIRISYRDIIKYTISLSDNNTCDWLIDFIGGMDIVDSHIKSLGITPLNLTETEESMHENIMRCYNNWSTPLAVAELLQKIYSGNILSKEHFSFLEKAMLDCGSGKDKLIAGLPAGINFGHKTGHSDRTIDGVQICDADAGVIYLPNGEKCFLVVLIKNSRESDTCNAAIMSDIARYVYSSFEFRPE